MLLFCILLSSASSIENTTSVFDKLRSIDIECNSSSDDYLMCLLIREFQNKNNPVNTTTTAPGGSIVIESITLAVTIFIAIAYTLKKSMCSSKNMIKQIMTEQMTSIRNYKECIERFNEHEMANDEEDSLSTNPETKDKIVRYNMNNHHTMYMP